MLSALSVPYSFSIMVAAAIIRMTAAKVPTIVYLRIFSIFTLLI